MKRKAKIWIGVLAFTLAVVATGWGTIIYVNSVYRDHSMLRVAAMTVDLHVRNRGKFPTSWQEMEEMVQQVEPDYDSAANVQMFSFDELSDAVTIDWRLGEKLLNDPEDGDQRLDDPIVGLKNGSHGRWHGFDPNEWLLDSLRR